MHFYPGLTPNIIADMSIEQTRLLVGAMPDVANIMEGEKPAKSRDVIRKEIEQAKRDGKINRMPTMLRMTDGVQ